MQRKFKKSEFSNKYASDSPKESIFRIQNAVVFALCFGLSKENTQASFKPFFTELYAEVGQWICLVVFGIFWRSHLF